MSEQENIDIAAAIAELAELKKKCLKQDGNPRADAKAEDIERIAQLTAEIDMAADAAANPDPVAKAVKDKKDDARAGKEAQEMIDSAYNRINAMREALRPLAAIECPRQYSDDEVLYKLGNVSITAGAIRTAAKLI